MLNGYGMSLIVAGFDIGIGSIASNWMLQPYVIFVYFGLNSPLLLSILFGVGRLPCW
jgi:ABC-type amino acid transport system permease subunit